MRPYFILITLSIALSVSATYMMVQLSGLNNAKPRHIEEIENTIKNFTNSRTALISLNLSQLYPNNTLYELLILNPQMDTDLNDSRFTKNENCNNKKNESFQSTMQKPTSPVANSLFEKDDLFQNYLCRKIKSLPNDFLAHPPLVSKNGLSFAYLLYTSGKEEFTKNEWVKSNAHHMAIHELKEISDELLDPPFRYIKNLDPSTLFDLMNFAHLGVSDKYFILKNLNNSQLQFYDLRQLEESFKKKDYLLKIHDGDDACFFQVSNLCIERTSSLTDEIASYPLYTLISLSILIFLAIIVITLRKIQNKAKENEQKKLAFRILTHELRTPVTNLILLSEEFQKSLESSLHKNEEMDCLQLKLENEIYRLKRLAEKSANYLNIEEHQNNLVLKLKKTTQIIDLTKEIVNDNFDNLHIHFDGPASDINQLTLMLDQYWYQTIIKNLIDNALKYGTGDVRLFFTIKNNSLGLSIQNNGPFPYKNLDDTLKNASPSNQGLGMGLSIVKTLAESMGGKLTLTLKPTTFTIWFHYES